ncbi:GntR family transcriptional regulator [Maritalea sp.]|jgi:DNA-binding GntR family transcriptional regulator|uniref:GntR family transcriptional regulator n=1 Tax=Maritalea sp. TaxID=2003361 RepID=UPI0039E53DC8
MGKIHNKKSQDTEKKAESTAGRRFRQIYEEIRSRISLLDYPPGTRLREEDLAEEFGVSRTPLRRVLFRLQSEGLLESVQGVGTIVTDISNEDLYQVYQLRMELAPLLARLSPLPITVETVSLFEDLFRQSEELTRNPTARGYCVVNISTFHALANLTANAPLRKAMELHFYQTASIWLKSLGPDDVEIECQNLHSEIRDFYHAVRIGDIDALSHLWRAHTSASVTRLRQKLGSSID